MASANNAKKGANVRMKRKERKNIAAGQAYMQLVHILKMQKSCAETG